MIGDGPIVAEVRERRHSISEQFRHDLAAYAKHLKEIEDRYRSRVVSQLTVVAERPPQRRDEL
ncbi:MAG: hypothetical protein HOP29_10965 [Phycisphaerales bacterium]|nr:hypothetical protein [Phycisphaerales bacterium]